MAASTGGFVELICPFTSGKRIRPEEASKLPTRIESHMQF
jgi:hypothetical protein